MNITIGQNLSTLIDTKLIINCTVKGIPVPKVTWTRGNETLPSDGRMMVKNGSLVIVELETSDSGNYTCFSENQVGKASVSSTVTVAGKHVSLCFFTAIQKTVGTAKHKAGIYLNKTLAVLCNLKFVDGYFVCLRVVVFFCVVSFHYKM